MNKAISLLCVLVVLTGCSNKGFYKQGQRYQKDKCIAEAQSSEAYNKCLESDREHPSYEDYEEARKSVTSE